MDSEWMSKKEACRTLEIRGGTLNRLASMFSVGTTQVREGSTGKIIKRFSQIGIKTIWLMKAYSRQYGIKAIFDLLNNNQGTPKHS